jgi:hypothetical protein
MPQQRDAQQSYTEGTLHLAILAIDQKQIKSEKRAAATFHIPRTTLQARRAGIQPRRDCQPNSKKLIKAEEEAIIKHILQLDSRGFAPTRDMVRDMANNLLNERGGKPAGKNWPDNFIKRTPALKTRWSRPYDRQRALNEDPRVISPWFSLIQSVKEKYGILDEDTYNFDETGFMMGVITSQLVVTSSEMNGKRKKVQPGNREWITVIQGINATGWAIPPFIIFAGKVLISSWYKETDIPHDWVITVSSNGWTTNELGVAWLEHFNKHTKARTVGLHRLLIVDGHESHNSVGFHQFCREQNIIALCMPSHSSHLLQPLDVGCFSPLKRAYGDEISGLARKHASHIDKEAFLPAFKAAFDKAFTKDNIAASFRGAGLVPFNPEAVLSKLDLRLRTPTPAAPEDTVWESKTPSNAREIQAQSTLICSRIRGRPGSSASSVNEKVEQLAKGAQNIAHEMVLMREEITLLREAAEAATKRKSRKRRYIRTEETLTVGEVADLIAPKESSDQEEGDKPAKRVRGVRCCGRCGETGHNTRTCKIEITNGEDSDESE